MTGIVGTDEWMISYKVGTVVANEFCYLWTNRNYRPDGSVPGFIYCSAYSGGAPYSYGSGFVKELARRGYPVLCGDFGDTPTAPLKTDGPGVWGNDASQTKLATYKAFLQNANNIGAKAGKIGLLYGSHGCALAYNYTLANPTQVSLLAGGIGTCDVEDIRANNRGGGSGLQASIEAAYTNNATWQTARPTHNPVEFASTLAIPQLDYYSTDDPISTPATHAALLAASGTNLTQRSLGAIGHSFSGLGLRSDPLTIAFCDWVEAHL